MIFYLREFYLPANFISVCIGLELAGYFLFQYKKLKKEKMGLDRFLLAFGIFYTFTFIGYLIHVIRRFYTFEDLIQNLLLRLMYMLILLGLIGFGLIISSKPFHKYLNHKIFYPLTICFFIPFIGLVFLDPGSIIFRLTLAPVLIAVPLIALFQLKLVRLSSKSMRRRMILIILGEIIVISAVIIGADIPQALFFQQNQDLLYTIAIPMFLSGLFIIFLGIYKFPVFLELNWKENLISLFIIDNKTPGQLYIHNFIEESSDETEEIVKINLQEIFSKGLIGIDSIIAAITDTATTKIEKIEQGEALILIEQGENPMTFITYALWVKQELSSARYFLKEVKRQFEGFFKDLLLNIESLRGSEKVLFSSFNIILNNLTSK